MSSNGSFQYEFDVELEDLPVMENAEYDFEVERRRREEETERSLLSRNLALIEIASCFRNGPEPLFEVLGPILWDHSQL